MKICRVFLFLVLLFNIPKIKAQVLKFDGVNDHVEINSAAGVNLRTIEFWFKLDNPIGPNLSNHVFLVGTDVPSPSVDEWTISFNPNGNSFLSGSIRFKYVVSAGVVEGITTDTTGWAANRWYHIAVVIDPVQGMKMFVNGFLQSTPNPNFVNSTGFNSVKVEIGRHGPSLLQHFAGEIDDVRFSSSAIYQNNFTPQCPDLVAQNSAVGLWNFNAGSGTIAADASGNNFNGQIVGANWLNSIICQNSCPSPTGLLATASGTNGLSLSWASGGANDWQIEYGISGFTLGNGNLIHVANNPFVINNLNNNTSYDFYVRDSCGPSEVSPWTGPVTFLSGCDTIAASFFSIRNFLNLQFDGSSSISATSWSWDFGDGSPVVNGSVLAHNYQNDGIYDVKLIAENDCGDQDTLVIPTAACDTLKAIINQSSLDSIYTFQASGVISGATSFIWYFGDGSQATGQVVSHTYSDTANYIVSLVVENICGDRDSIFKSTGGCGPVHSFWTRSLAGTTQNGMQVDFNANASINAVKYHWDFGDGNSKTVNSFATTHTYAVPSLLYVVCLNVENLCGDTDQSCRALNQIGLKEFTLLDNNFKVYPNPANDFVNIELEGVKGSFEISFYTVNAELLSRKTVQTGDEGLRYKMDIDFLPKGIYLLQIPTSEGVLTRKIMIY